MGHSVAFLLLALALYVATPQACFHGTDWRFLVLWTEQPGVLHPQHPGYLLLAKLWCAPGRWLGWSTQQSLLLLSAVAGASCVAIAHSLAWRRWRDARLAATVAGVFAFLPGMWHHATVVEMHMPFLAVALLALRSALAAAPAWRKGLATGALTAVATWLHATGHGLAMLLAAASWWLAPRERSRWLMPLTLLCTHALLWGGLFAFARTCFGLPAGLESAPKATLLDADGGPLLYFWRGLQRVDPLGSLLPTLWREWLAPFAPVSLLCVGLWFALPRRHAASFFLAVGAYLALALAILGAITDERGAYLLPIGGAAAVLTVCAAPRWAWPWLVLGTIPCGLLLRGEPGRAPADIAFGTKLAAAARGQDAVWFLSDYAAMDGAFWVNPRLELLVARKEYEDLRAQGRSDASAEQIAGWLQLKRAEANRMGKRLIVLDDARAYLQARVPQFAAGWQIFVQQVGVTRLPPELVAAELVN